MTIQELNEKGTKKGKERIKFLDQKITMQVTMVDGTTEPWHYTVNEVIQEFVYLKKNMTMVNIFIQAMASCFYKVDPENEFFKSCDKKFIDSLTQGKNKTEMETMLARLKEAVSKHEEPGEEPVMPELTMLDNTKKEPTEKEETF